MALAAVTENLHVVPRPRFANAEPLPSLLVYLCHRPKVYKLLPGSGRLLIGPCFTAGKVIPNGSFCIDFWRGLWGTGVLSISIPGQNQKSIPGIPRQIQIKVRLKRQNRYMNNTSIARSQWLPINHSNEEMITALVLVNSTLSFYSFQSINRNTRIGSVRKP